MINYEELRELHAMTNPNPPAKQNPEVEELEEETTEEEDDCTCECVTCDDEGCEDCEQCNDGCACCCCPCDTTEEED